MLARPLLRSIVYSPSTVPEVFEVTAAPNGGWPGALGGQPFQYNGYAYVGFATNAGGIKIAVFNHASGAITVRTLVADASMTNDQHNRPALLRRSTDNKLVYALCDHVSPFMHVGVSVNSLDSDPTISGGFGADQEIDAQLGGTGYTYPALFEFDGQILLFYRDFDGLSNWEISTHALDTTSLSAGWAAFTNLVYGTRVYAMATQPASDRLDIFVTDGSYAEDFASIYHFYREGSDYFTSDGSMIAGSPPFDFADLTLVYDGAAAGVRSPGDCVNDGSEIVVAFPVQTGTPSGHLGEDEDYLYARVNVGSDAWNVETIQADVGALTFEFTEGSMATDPANINRVIVSRRATSDLGDPFHMYEYVTADGGATWDITPISVSGDPDMYPNFVRDHQPELQCVWLKGSFTSQSVFDTGVQGYGVPA